jgi:hypothetical protein
MPNNSLCVSLPSRVTRVALEKHWRRATSREALDPPSPRQGKQHHTFASTPNRPGLCTAKDQKEVDADHVSVHIRPGGEASARTTRRAALPRRQARVQCDFSCGNAATSVTRDSPRTRRVEMTRGCFGHSDGRPERSLTCKLGLGSGDGDGRSATAQGFSAVRGRQRRNEQILVDRLAKLGLRHVTAANTTTRTLIIASTLAFVA